ncbi:MAG: serine hydrolase domain-containing protein [Bacteroidota bacterium]
MNVRLMFLFLSLATLPLAAQSDAIQFTNEDGTTTSMEERMAAEQTKGAALLVMVDGEVLLQENWGWRDAEQQLPVENETIFQIGSMSQPVTQFAIMRLVSDGVLDLDTDINQYLSSWQLPENKITANKPVTIRDLCLHRRGFKFPYKPDGFAAGQAMPNHLQLLNGEKPAQNPPVRLKKDLNQNGDHTFAGALIMQQILMDHYEQSFEQIAQEQVFAPLGMTSSFFAAELTAEQKANLAVGYGPNKQRLEDDYKRYPELAASGMYTTTYDYAIFVQALLDAVAGRDNRFINQALAQEALAPANNDEAMMVNRSDNEFFWGGATKGYYTQFEADAKDHNWVVVAFMNDHINWSFNGALRRQGIAYAKTQMNTATGSTSEGSEKR